MARPILACDDRNMLFDPRTESSSGFSPIVKPVSFPPLATGDWVRTGYYDPADEGPPSDSSLAINLCEHCISVSYQRTSQLTALLNLAQSVTFGFPMAPFISRRLNLMLCCDGRWSAEFGGSHMPSHIAYINGVEVASRGQSGLAKFITGYSSSAVVPPDNFYGVGGTYGIDPNWD